MVCEGVANEYLAGREYLAYAVEGIESFTKGHIEVVGKGHGSHGRALIFRSHLDRRGGGGGGVGESVLGQV